MGAAPLPLKEGHGWVMKSHHAFLVPKSWASPILYVPTFPWKYFLSTKWERREEIKRELFTQREVPVQECSHEGRALKGTCTLRTQLVCSRIQALCTQLVCSRVGMIIMRCNIHCTCLHFRWELKQNNYLQGGHNPNNYCLLTKNMLNPKNVQLNPMVSLNFIKVKFHLDGNSSKYDLEVVTKGI